jgi:hypothetical protein
MSLVPLFDGKDSIYLPSHSSNLEDHMRVWMDLGGAPAPAYLWRGAPTYLSIAPAVRRWWFRLCIERGKSHGSCDNKITVHTGIVHNSVS